MHENSTTHYGNATPLQELHHRQGVIRDRVRSVAARRSTGFYLCGRAGTAKTFTVRKTLEDGGVLYHYDPGHLTPLGLFELLDEQHDRIIVLDDVSDLLTKPVGLQILLAALGNQSDDSGARIVRYRRQGRAAVVRFTGGIIAISNLELHPTPILTALKSRVHYLQYDPSDEQIAALMRHLAAGAWPAATRKVSPSECSDVCEFVIRESERRAGRLDMRLLVDKALPDYLQWRDGKTETHWKDLAISTVEEHLIALVHTPVAA